MSSFSISSIFGSKTPSFKMCCIICFVEKVIKLVASFCLKPWCKEGEKIHNFPKSWKTFKIKLYKKYDFPHSLGPVILHLTG